MRKDYFKSKICLLTINGFVIIICCMNDLPIKNGFRFIIKLDSTNFQSAVFLYVLDSQGRKFGIYFQLQCQWVSMIHFGDFPEWKKQFCAFNIATSVRWVGITGPKLLDLTCRWTAITINGIAIITELKAFLESISAFGGTINHSIGFVCVLRKCVTIAFTCRRALIA